MLFVTVSVFKSMSVDLKISFNISTIDHLGIPVSNKNHLDDAYSPQLSLMFFLYLLSLFSKQLDLKMTVSFF